MSIQGNHFNALPALGTISLAPHPKAKMATVTEYLLSRSKLMDTLVGTTYKGIYQHKGNDYKISLLDDAIKTSSIAFIALLLSLGKRTMTNKISIWLGALGWWGSMKAYPVILNKIIELKTGVPLSAYYKTPDNQIKPFFSDPDYLPTQILPYKTITQLCKRYAIPMNTELTLDKIQNRLKQIAVQTHTWWMLTTGIATPLLASMFCDILENPAKQLYIDAKTSYYTSALKSRSLGKDNYAIEWASHYINKIIETKVGKNQLIKQTNLLQKGIPEALLNTAKNTQLSLWWSKFPTDLIKTMGLDNSVLLSYLSNPKYTEENNFQALVDSLIQELKPLKNREKLETYLKAQQKKINSIIDPLLHLLNTASPAEPWRNLHPHSRIQFNQQIRLARGSALGTIEHFKQLMTTFEQFQHASPSVLRRQIRQILEKPNASYVEALLREGKITRIHQMTGSLYFDETLRCLQKGSYLPIHDLLGESPKNLLLDS